MKIYKYIVLSLALATGSCTGVIEEVNPTHILSDTNAFVRATDYETALSGAYAQLRAVNLYGRDQASLPDMMTDNLSESPENLPQGTRGLVDWQAASDNGQIENNWTLMYRMINSTNIVINGIDAFANASNQRTVNRIKGQALALRALGHFDLLKWYANNYERNSGDPAVPISTISASTDPNIRPARATVREVYDQIFRDLNEANQLLANVDAAINTASNRSRIDGTVVNALLARVSLYAGQWADAIRFSTEVTMPTLPKWCGISPSTRARVVPPLRCIRQLRTGLLTMLRPTWWRSMTKPTMYALPHTLPKVSAFA
ncbi:MAG: RagB/SusD family nutrient uptake outer membrane protein [Bernardetiaceae bacterium]|nr:RagB/SusD family nutrient uptake outer membrane protein [Bernardetiaceae bacterium]